MTIAQLLEIISMLAAAAAFIFTAVGWIVKSVINRYIDKDIANHKALLDKDIENYKSQRLAENTKLQISYGGIFEKQANAIIEIYSTFIKLESESKENLDDSANWIR